MRCSRKLLVSSGSCRGRKRHSEAAGEAWPDTDCHGTARPGLARRVGLAEFRRDLVRGGETWQGRHGRRHDETGYECGLTRQGRRGDA
jgi:hypothetical protein